jgi:hypothetical protein
MEPYRSYCPHCKSEYTWTGYKSGIGKSKEQLEQMEKDHSVCRSCGHDGLITELDFGDSIAHKYQNVEAPAEIPAKSMKEKVLDILNQTLYISYSHERSDENYVGGKNKAAEEILKLLK